jgi:shikimate 5-dehydrogenase
MKPLDEMIDAQGARVAVIGAGGSARAICYGLSLRVADVTIYARDLKKAQPLADEFKARTAPLESFKGEADVVINCAPVGMSGHSEGQSLIKSESLEGVKLVYDLIYTPEETALLGDAKRAGCRTLGGLAMLVGQAAEQFRLWTGLEAPIDVMWEAASLR